MGGRVRVGGYRDCLECMVVDWAIEALTVRIELNDSTIIISEDYSSLIGISGVLSG